MPVKISELPSQTVIREYLTYNPNTGDFHWRKKTSVRSPEPGSRAGTKAVARYVRVTLLGRSCFAHRLAWVYVNGSIPDGMEVDHRNGDRTDNAISNLRLANRTQQCRNKSAQSNSSSGIKGVSFDRRRGKWRAQIQFDGKKTEIGAFATADGARAAYQSAARRHFGEFFSVRAAHA